MSRTDPAGEFFLTALLIVVGVTAVAATANDIYQIARTDGEGVSVEVNGDSVQIRNSYKVVTPWMQWGYSVYVNHFSEGSDIIKGTSVGVAFEWHVHNAAYYATSAAEMVGINAEEYIGTRESLKNVDLEATIFNDTGHGAKSVIMQTVYTCLFPRAARIDKIIASIQ